MRIGILFFLLLVSTVVHASVFEIYLLNEQAKNSMKKLKTWKPTCPIPLERLRLIKFSYYDFEGQEKNDGEMIVLDVAAKRILRIFEELHESKFPISKARPIEYYGGNDEKSMEDNNSSCFNCRETTGGGLFSIHSYGLAIDLNPVQNPYLFFEKMSEYPTTILPSSGKDYISRIHDRPGMAEKVVEIFRTNGFTTWGGKWKTPMDLHHFESPRSLGQLLSVMSPEDGEEFFEMYAEACSKIFDSFKPNENKLVSFYKHSPSKFMDIFRTHKNQIFNSDNGDKALVFIEKKINDKVELQKRVLSYYKNHISSGLPD